MQLQCRASTKPSCWLHSCVLQEISLLVCQLWWPQFNAALNECSNENEVLLSIVAVHRLGTTYGAEFSRVHSWAWDGKKQVVAWARGGGRLVQWGVKGWNSKWVAGRTTVVHSGAQSQPRITALLGFEKEILPAYHLGFNLSGFPAIGFLGFSSLWHKLPSLPTYMLLQLYVGLLQLKTNVLQRLRSRSQLSA